MWFSFRKYEFKNCLVTSCHFQASSHFRNQNTFNLQDWLALILYVGVWSKKKNIFVKIPFERSISWFQNNKKTKKRHVSFKDEMWPQNKMQNGKNSIQHDWQFNALLGSTILAISVFTEQFRSLVILRMFWRQNDQWQAPSQIPLVFCSPICGLDSCNYSTEWPEIPPWYSNLLFGLYHIRNSGCMGFNRVRQKVWNLTDASSPTWVAERC